MKFFIAILIFYVGLQHYVCAMETALIIKPEQHKKETLCCCNFKHNEQMKSFFDKHQHDKPLLNVVCPILDFDDNDAEDVSEDSSQEEDEEKYFVRCCVFTNGCAIAGSVGSILAASSLSKCLVVTAGFGGGIAGTLCGCLFCTMVRFMQKVVCT